jgi:transcriptional antiterminator RfaH
MHGTIGMRRNVDLAPVPASFPSGDRWYVVRTNIRCEDRAQMGLSAAGFRAFLPQVTKWKKHARISTVGKVPLFPRYLFVEADFNKQSITDIHQTHGVESIINNNGVPSSIYGEFIVRLLERQLRGEFDNTRDEVGRQNYPIGARIIIAEGKWEDAIGVIERFKGGQRAEILVSIMGRKMRQTLELANMRPKW